MEPFLKRFFPHVLQRMATAKGNEYCIYDSQALTAFTSSLYVAGLVSSLVAARVTRVMGRQAVMLMGGALFFTGGVVTGAAVNIAMLIVGRMLLGFGVGFTNQVSLTCMDLKFCCTAFFSLSLVPFIACVQHKSLRRLMAQTQTFSTGLAGYFGSTLLRIFGVRTAK
jgi:MFS family permease